MVPTAVRDVAAVAGVLLVATSAVSVVGTVIKAIARLGEVNFPIERDPAEAWPQFVGWRVNYERAAYAIAATVDVVPPLWSGPRRHPTAPILPLRPMPGQTDSAATD